MLTYVLLARDSSTTPPGKPLVGLTPQWVFLRRLDDGRDLIPPPPIAEIGHGQYKFSFDPEAVGDTSGQVDLGASVANPSDRFVDVVLYVSDSRIRYNLDMPVSKVWKAPDRRLTAPPPGVAAPLVIVGG